jgi:hypothetical protein
MELSVNNAGILKMLVGQTDNAGTGTRRTFHDIHADHYQQEVSDVYDKS